MLPARTSQPFAEAYWWGDFWYERFVASPLGFLIINKLLDMHSLAMLLNYSSMPLIYRQHSQTTSFPRGKPKAKAFAGRAYGWVWMITNWTDFHGAINYCESCSNSLHNRRLHWCWSRNRSTFSRRLASAAISDLSMNHFNALASCYRSAVIDAKGGIVDKLRRIRWGETIKGIQV